MEKYFELMANAGVEVYIIIGIVVIAFVAVVVKVLRKPHHKIPETKMPSEPAEGEAGEAKEEGKSVLGTGDVKCMCFRKVRNINVLDFTTMPKPIGEVYEFETSCPFSGTGYIVKEENAQVADYDPRKVCFKFMESPQVAWMARHWDIVKDVFAVPLSMWKSPSTYFAIMMIAAVFVWGLVVFD